MTLLFFLGFMSLGIAGVGVFYFMLLPLGSLIPVNRVSYPGKNGVNIFISTNGMHTDFIIPVKNHLFDWSNIIDSTPFHQPISQTTYLGMGWGDPGFYLELESWDKLTFKIAARALLYPTPTIMHIIAYDELPADKKRVEKICLTPSQYLHLCSFIYNSFALNEEQEMDLIPGVGYGENDNFYHAKGSYHAFHTCNYWVNKGLKKIGVRTALWSPLDRGIFYQLDKMNKKIAGSIINSVAAVTK